MPSHRHIDRHPPRQKERAQDEKDPDPHLPDAVDVQERDHIPVIVAGVGKDNDQDGEAPEGVEVSVPAVSVPPVIRVQHAFL